MSKADKLHKEIREAYAANEQAADAADKARAEYDAAISAGDFDKAKAHQLEVAEHEAEARRWADRIDALEAKRPQAETEDAMPQYRQAMKEAKASIEAERECHQRVAEAILHLGVLRKELEQVHEDSGRKVAAAHRAADAAHQARDEFKDRSRLQAAADLDYAFRLIRELGNVSDYQAQQVHNSRERARKAA